MDQIIISHHSQMIYGEGKKELFFQSWIPNCALKGVLLIIHGLGEHSGRYQNLVDHLTQKGYALFGLDHEGHGQSEGTPGHINNINDLVTPISEVTERLLTEYQQLPIFLYGQSMGGLLTTKFLLDHSPPLQGAILTSPSFSIPENTSTFTVVLGKILAGVLPRFPLNGLDVEQLSKDPTVVKKYQEDPLVFQGKYSARFAIELLTTIQEVKEKAPGIGLPLLVLAGGQDRIALAEDTQEIYEKISSLDKTYLLYPELRHELINEPERNQVLQDISVWLDEHSAAHP